MSSNNLTKEAVESEQGRRTPGGASGRLLALVALSWSIFQLWVASPLPYTIGLLVFNDTEVRSIHLAFALLLGLLLYPLNSHAPVDRPWAIEWLIAAAASLCALYLFIFQMQLAERPGLPTTFDLIAGISGIILLLEATRRVLGLPLVILAILFISYLFLGPWMPETIAHRGASLTKATSHLWITSEGVFGVALGVSAGFIFLFVLFGALLERAGAGHYFIRLAMALLGHLRGGPAKAAVVASASTGIISGSSIANVVTTGTFTIPLMKRVGYPPHKAAAIEVAASVDGQIMPPVMGAAAFLMVEYVGIPYTEVLKHALLPALISYIALFYIVHLEALKAGIEGTQRSNRRGWGERLLQFAFGGVVTAVAAGALHWLHDGLNHLDGPTRTVVATAVVIALYLLLLRIAASRQPLLHASGDEAAALPARELFMSGLHYLLPVALLIWNLMVEELSPALSAFWATALMALIVTTQPLLLGWFNGDLRIRQALLTGIDELLEGLIQGARSMIPIGIATAAAGIIVGTITLSGIGLVMTEFIESVSGGHLGAMLLMVALICLILGMGLPTTANYIVVSTLMAPVVVTIAADHGLFVPLIAVHLFVFYFGLMADITPPVGLASYAAAGVARSDPLKTGITAFNYGIRTAILPFMFIFNSQLLLIGIDSIPELIMVVAAAIAANLVFAAAWQGWLITRNRLHETLILLLVTFTLFRPDFWLDQLSPPYQRLPASKLLKMATNADAGEQARIWIEGTTIEGDEVERGILLPLGEPAANARQRLMESGLTLIRSGDNLQVMMVRFGSTAERLGLEQGFTITSLEQPRQRPAAEWLYIPAAIAFALVYLLQRRRLLLIKKQKEQSPGTCLPE